MSKEKSSLMQTTPSGDPMEYDDRIHLRIPEGLDDLWDRFAPDLLPEKSQPPPTSDLPTSTNNPPRMNILMLVVGSQGDVQPFIAIALELQQYGHRVRLATHAGFRRFVENQGIEFFDLGGSPVELMAYMVQNPGLLPRFAAWRHGDVLRKRRVMQDIILSGWRACFETPSVETPSPAKLKVHRSDRKKPQVKQKDPKPFVADAIIANPPSLSHVHCAEKLGIPLHIFFTMPWSPTTRMPHPLASIKHSAKQIGKVNALSYYLVESLIWQGLGSIINHFRYKTLHLDPIHPSRGPTILQTAQVPHTYLWSPSLLPKPADWQSNISVTGYAFLDTAKDYTLPERLQQFLAAGPPPIYIGFGSIVISNPTQLLDLAVAAVHATGHRALLAPGWSGHTPTSPNSSTHTAYTATSNPKTYVLQSDIPHTHLFPHVLAIIHHGGAGTTAASLRCGIPTITIPFFGDQFFWGAVVHNANAGPAPLPHVELTSEKLVCAIEGALREDVRASAARLGEEIAMEEGVKEAVRSWDERLPVVGLRCGVLGERVAVWRWRGRGGKHGGKKGDGSGEEVLLSAVAAVVLHKKRLLEWKDLELHRKVEVEVAHGAYEPASGAAWAVTELLIDGIRGMGEMLAEVVMVPVSSWRVCERIVSEKGKGKVPSVDRRVEVGTDLGDGTEAVYVEVQNSAGDLSGRPPAKPHRLPGGYMVGGAGRVLKATARAPGAFSAAMATGAHDLPRLWGDDTVRPAHKVTGVGSGMIGGGKELFWGLADGISGPLVQPIQGLMKDGPGGFVKGAGKGVLGMPVKFFAAACGLVGYPLKGIDLAVSRTLQSDGMAAVRFQRMLQGEHDFLELTEDVRTEVIRRWQVIMAGRGAT